MCCGEGPRRSVPTNYIILGIFTITEALLVATIASFYTAYSVLVCIAMLGVAVLGLSLFACQVRACVCACVCATSPTCALCNTVSSGGVPDPQTRRDLTTMGGTLACGL